MQNTQSATAACVATRAAVVLAVFHWVESNLLKKRSHSFPLWYVAVCTWTIILKPQGASFTFCHSEIWPETKFIFTL